MDGNPVKGSGLRKQWKLAGTRIFANGCQGFLAVDGCPDSQVGLAKKLLEEDCDDEADQKQKDQLGVYWLIKASEQGHEEATVMLRKCLKSGRGISDLNVSDVKSCLSMPLSEKVSRHAARELFANLSQGEGFITIDQLYDEMERTQKSSAKEARNSIEDKVQPHCSKDIDWESRVCVSPEKLTEDMLVSAASHHSKGEIPIVHRVMMVNKTHSQRKSLQASLLSPLNRMRSSYEYFIDSLGKCPIRSFWPLNATCLQTLVILAIYSSLGFEGIMEAIPSLMYYSAIGVMFITTCQILTKKWEFDQLKRWSNLLVAWGGPRVNADEAQWTHCSNNIYPCFVFLFALIASILLTPFVSPYNIPYSELTVTSVIASLLVLYNYSWYKGKVDYLAIVSFGVGMLARYPYETDEVVSTDWRFIDLKVHNFASYVVGNGIEFCLNFKVIFFLMMPGLLIKMGSREKWKGVYISLVPHLISLSWWQMAVVLSNGATRFGLIRSCLAVLVIILFIPLAGLTIVLLPLIAILRFFLATETVLPVSVAMATASVSLVLLVYLGTRPTGKVMRWVQICFGVMAAGLLIWPHVETFPHEWYSESVPLTWDQYSGFCSPNDSNPMKAKSQEKCATLSGLYVHWEGLVESTSIVGVHNPLANVVSKLPLKVQQVITCMYGEKYESCEGDCKASGFLANKCHLSNWNRYEFAIVVKMAAGAWMGEEAITLRGDTVFRNFTTSLSLDDKIWFAGSLEVDPTGNQFNHTQIRLHQAGCLACSASPPPPLTVQSLSSIPSMSEMYVAVRNLLNFVFNPAIIFKDVNDDRD